MSPENPYAIPHSSRSRLCLTCHSIGTPRKITKGSLIIEIFLWLLLILPGAIYSVWRLASKYEACPTCGATNCVPLGTPAAQRILNQEDEYEDD